MDKERRSRLKRVVSEARKNIEGEIKTQLRRLGIEEHRIRSLQELPPLTKEEIDVRESILKAIEKEKVGGISDEEAYERYIRHVGFTFINRIAALRAMEVRGLIKETIIKREYYGGRSQREYEIAEKSGSEIKDLTKASLIEAFKEISSEIKVLFDLNDEYSLIFPGAKTVNDLIKLFTEDIPEEDWKEDDIIGWIYQYYNEEARAKFKKEKRKPKADDIPVINQFYTPRWIVRVLVDNTLGRLWLEMKGRCPKLGDKIERGREKLENPSGETVDEYCSYLVPLPQDHPLRAKKSVREIKVLDPACGSGHFLVYAFDVLYRMYREDEPQTPLEEIPALILENNLYGIDIDLRAVQLAALSLYLKAKSYNPKIKISKMNLVCGDARITDGRVRAEFLKRFSHDPALQKIFAKLFEDLEYTYEIGSLLKVREPFEKLLAERKKSVQATFAPALIGQIQLSPEGELMGQSKLAPKETTAGGEEGASIISIPQTITLNEMLQALVEFEREALEKHDMGTLLFATEAEKSVGLLSLLSQKYDVVLMNPPYGDMPTKTKEYLRKYYPKTHFDYYAAFIEQAIDLAQDEGYVGALTGRTFMFLKWYQWVREVLFKERAPPQLVFDLGFGVLDAATARWAAFTAQKIRVKTQQNTTFVRLIEYANEPEKKTAWEEVIKAIRLGKTHHLVYQTALEDLSKIPTTPFSYWTSESLRRLFTYYPPLDRDVAGKTDHPKNANVKVGLQTGDDIRFTRLWWEVPISLITTERKKTSEGKKWVPFANDVYLYYFFADVQTVVNWNNDGEDIRGFAGSRVRNEKFYFHQGLTWSVSLQRSQLKNVRFLQRIPFRILPQGSIFGIASHGVFLDKEKTWALLAICCSKLIYYLSRLIAPDKMAGTGSTASLPIASLNLSDPRIKKLDSLAHEAHDLLMEWTTGEEVSTIFIKPWIFQVLYGFNPKEKPITQHPSADQFEWPPWSSSQESRSIKGTSDMSLKELSEFCVKRQLILNKRIEEIQKEIDEEVYHIYGISDEDRALIERDFALHVDLEEEEEATEEIGESSKDVIPAREHVARLVSFYVKRTMEASDSIVMIHDLIKGVRDCIAKDFGEEQVERRMKEIKDILGMTLEDWIVSEYFDFHVNLYRRRPIFWHLTSANFTRGRRARGAFNCFLYYHKLDRETIPKIRANYLRIEIERAKREVDRLKRELQEARDKKDKKKEAKLSKEFENALGVLEEIQSFDKALEVVHNPRETKTELPKNARWVDRAIAEVRDNGWNPIIDHGVRVNIEPLKEAKLLHRAAERVK